MAQFFQTGNRDGGRDYDEGMGYFGCRCEIDEGLVLGCTLGKWCLNSEMVCQVWSLGGCLWITIRRVLWSWSRCIEGLRYCCSEERFRLLLQLFLHIQIMMFGIEGGVWNESRIGSCNSS